jgi:acyl-CoA reductase-like NAD-dependent aldehyde dehydrogenase
MIDHTASLHYRHMVQPLGNAWEASSFMWGTWAGTGASFEQRSPANNSCIQIAHVLDQQELDRLLQAPMAATVDQAEVWAFTERLHTALHALAPLLLETMQLETGFTGKDCEELLEGTLTYMRDFKQSLDHSTAAVAEPLPYHAGHPRHIRLARSAWGTVAVILPQNAFLLIAVTTMLNALSTGNRVILRAPQQSARSAALLGIALEAAKAPVQAVSIVLAKAREFVDALCRSRLPLLIHYMGSSQHGAQLVANAFRAGKPVLIDGSGNGWIWVDADTSAETAVDILTTGALRYNGQTCTSVNGAMIHPSLYPHVRDRLMERWNRLTVGNPLAAHVDVGPLFDEEQARWCQQQIEQSGGSVLCGGKRNGNLLHPTLVEHPAPHSALVCEGLFGGGLWITAGTRDEFVSWWQQNQYPLCAGVLDPAADTAWWLSRLPNVARLVVNGDPSVEHIFEPWGGYPSSGMNSVSVWHEKYQRVVSVDEPTLC